MKVIPALYIYDRDSGDVIQLLNFRYTHDTFNKYTLQEKEHYFAENGTQRIEISEKSGQIFENDQKHTLNIWYHEINRVAAIDAFFDYIYGTIEKELEAHNKFIAELEKNLKNLKAVK